MSVCRRNSLCNIYKRFFHGEVIAFCMPTLSPTMVSGKLLNLLVKEGDKVQSYQHFITISTTTLTKLPDNNNDKEMEIEIMEDEYYVAKYFANMNDTISINEPIALLCENKDDINDVKKINDINDVKKQFRIGQWQGYLKSK